MISLAPFLPKAALESVESSHTLPNSVLKQIGARPRTAIQPQVRQCPHLEVPSREGLREK
jgi:hypothetical protein